MEIKYSKTEFEGYTHRFVVQFETDEPHYNTMHIYSNSQSYLELDNFIRERKSDRVRSFKIIHSATKEQDERDAELINEWLKE